MVGDDFRPCGAAYFEQSEIPVRAAGDFEIVRIELFIRAVEIQEQVFGKIAGISPPIRFNRRDLSARSDLKAGVHAVIRRLDLHGIPVRRDRAPRAVKYGILICVSTRCVDGHVGGKTVFRALSAHVEGDHFGIFRQPDLLKRCIEADQNFTRLSRLVVLQSVHIDPEVVALDRIRIPMVVHDVYKFRSVMP